MKPQVLRGMRDILPERMGVRQYAIGVLRRTFERYGFQPLETPAMEYAETLTGKYGEEADRLIYQFEDRGGRQVGLRYDLTVPLCRVVASYPEMPRPFKRYQIAPVWRAERPQKGRYREFWQCDVDTVGSSSMLADAELLGVATGALRELGFSEFRIKLNNRKLLVALAECAGVPPEQASGVYRAIDKLEKIGAEAVRAEMQEEGLPEAAADRLLALVQRQDADTASMLAEVSRELADYPLGVEGAQELAEVMRYAEALGVTPQECQVDLSMVRGLEYYTGPILEAVVERPRIGSIIGGGRYDHLVGLLGGQDIPATGLSFGLERIIDVLEELDMAPAEARQTIAQVLVTIFSPETAGESLRLAQELRAAGVRTEVYLGTDKLGAQLRYASRKGIPFVAIMGPDEVQRGEVTVKAMAGEGGQQCVSRAAVATCLRAAP